MRYRLDQKQAEMFARSIMPALYRLQKMMNIRASVEKNRRYVIRDNYDISVGSQRFVRVDRTADG